MKHSKKIPYRTCIGCKQVKPKRDLLRIIRTPEGKIEVDKTGKKSGRGAYLCYNVECFKEALKKNGILKALKVDLSQDKIKEIENVINKLKEE